jgi:hypothetical protein
MGKVTAALDRASDEQRKAMGQLSDGNGNCLVPAFGGSDQG